MNTKINSKIIKENIKNLICTKDIILYNIIISKLNTKEIIIGIVKEANNNSYKLKIIFNKNKIKSSYHMFLNKKDSDNAHNIVYEHIKKAINIIYPMVYE